MTARPRWIVLKFGGTSVSSRSNWDNIAAVVRRRSADGTRVLVVHSAISGVTDRLERLLAAALTGAHAAELAGLEERHRALAHELGVGTSPALEGWFAELSRAAAAIAHARAVGDAMRARVMASGELMATEIGARFLAAQGLGCRWWDAREGLHAVQRDAATAAASYLSATCAYASDPALAARLASLAPVVLTQGFIASNAGGETVLLGRGGSDTSGAYFASLLAAERLEIWTDVPGMFSANPRSMPSARLLRQLHYDEAQEIASSGAKVLHPRCILPARQAQIPVWIYATQAPELEGTHIGAAAGDGPAQVKAVCIRKGVTLVSLDSPGMWHEVGFLANAFQVFRRHGMSVDQVSTSETSVTVSLDPAANSLDSTALDALVAELSQLCGVQVIGPCASVSLVGRNIRGILHRLGGALELFAEQRIHMVSQAANDLNFTFVVDEAQGDRLVQELHDLLIRPVRGDGVLGPSWAELHGAGEQGQPAARPWWERQRAQLLDLCAGRDSLYVYDRATVRGAARALRGLASVDRIYYAMKANPHRGLLAVLAEEGLGLECVSPGELDLALATLGASAHGRILYTPNFAPRAEYERAFVAGVQVTVDNTYVLQQWPDAFRGREVLLRVDTGTGRGHHQHVRTAGEHSKFGIPLAELDVAAALAQAAGCTVAGLHAHPGSGVLDVGSWGETCGQLLANAARFPGLRAVNVGGGLGVPDRREQAPLDLAALDAALAAARRAAPGIEVWLEPGRFLVAAAGVLLARVTQLKGKGESRYVGVATGMNALIRPALYGSWHEIVNLSRLDEPATEPANVVGPICESADVLGHDRLLPPTREGDVLLVANTGAYGHAMSSSYNLRPPPEEILI